MEIVKNQTKEIHLADLKKEPNRNWIDLATDWTVEELLNWRKSGTVKRDKRTKEIRGYSKKVYHSCNWSLSITASLELYL